mmetsp:Transcript_28620/g.27420  ORF Transcript_28620/g.27420 Transcript_28620/m.27420 type:complete len:98 (-) Transcript_28620:948-1241(-)
MPSILKDPSMRAKLRGFNFKSLSLPSAVNHTFSIGILGGIGSVDVEEGEVECSFKECSLEVVLGEVVKEVEDGEGLIGDGKDNEERRGVDDDEDNTG